MNSLTPTQHDHLLAETQREDFTSDVRDCVLNALDIFALENGGGVGQGWKDRELDALFKGVDAHAEALWERFGREVAIARARKEVQS